jgi:hypothetical protein
VIWPFSVLRQLLRYGAVLPQERLPRELLAQGHGPCCPTCGIPGYANLGDKQDRRELHIEILQAKMAGEEQRKRQMLAKLRSRPECQPRKP